MQHTTSPWSEAVLVNTPALQPSEVRMILVTGTDLLAMQEAALTLFDAGHIPVIGEWFAQAMAALPACGAAFEDLFEPMAERLLSRADGVLRLEGVSSFSDSLVQLARKQGLRVFSNVDEVLAG
jgi:hypothetical protein